MQVGFYTSGVAGQLAQDKLNDINQNLANVNTIGYMATRSSFAASMAEQVKTSVDMKEGTIKQTGNTLDFAIQGNAFFRVRLDDGREAYTRAGNFKLGTEGYLLTQSGQSVLDKNGTAIQLPAGQITAGQDGSLRVNGAEVAAFGLMSIMDSSKLTRIGNAMLTTAEDNLAVAGKEAVVRQMAVEGSNVNPILAMTEMVSTTRDFEATMKIIEQFNKQSGQLNTQVGLVQG